MFDEVTPVSGFGSTWSARLAVARRVVAIGLGATAVLVVSACSGNSRSASGVIPIDDTTGATARTDWVATEKTEVELASGAKIAIQVSIGEVVSVTAPDAEIDSQCGLEDLPKVGTAYQQINVRVESKTTRNIQYPSVLVGYLNNDGAFTSLWKNWDYSIGGAPIPRFCVPKNLLETSIKATSSHIGFGEYQMTPGQVENINDVLVLEPSAPTDLQWALFVTSDADEAESSSRILPSGQTPGARIIPLHTFKSTDLPTLDGAATTGPGLLEEACEALRDLNVPNAEPADSPRLETLRKVAILTDYDFIRSVEAVVQWYETNPSDDRRPFSYGLAISKCEDYGL